MKVVFEQRLEKMGGGGVSAGYIWQKGMPGRGNGTCKGVEVGVYQVYLRNSKEDSEVRNEREMAGLENRAAWGAGTLGAFWITGEALNIKRRKLPEGFEQRD